jgi:hypothetical protein
MAWISVQNFFVESFFVRLGMFRCIHSSSGNSTQQVTHLRSSSSASSWRFTKAKTRSVQLTQWLRVLMMYGSNIVKPVTSQRESKWLQGGTQSKDKVSGYKWVPSQVKVKVKVKLSLCFNWAPRHGGVLGEWRYSSIHSLTSALDGGEWSDSRPGRFTPRERASGANWIGGWVGPRAVLDAVVKRNIPSPRRESNPRTPIVQPVAQRYTGT